MNCQQTEKSTETLKGYVNQNTMQDLVNINEKKNLIIAHHKTFCTGTSKMQLYQLKCCITVQCAQTDEHQFL